jgi:outer membrane immunogenic protein
MRKIIFAAATVLAASSAAGAADLPRSNYYAPQQQRTGFNWTGAYAGINAGYQWGDTTNSPNLPANDTHPSGVMGGVQLGYNWQSGQFVFGGETDLQISGADDTFAPYKFSNPWFGTLRGRAGVVYSNFLFYGTAGLAYGGVKGEIAGLDESKTHGGWTAGAGVEVALNQAWTAKAEYLYVDLGNRSYSITGVKNGIESNLIRFGVNYHF